MERGDHDTLLEKRVYYTSDPKKSSLSDTGWLEWLLLIRSRMLNPRLIRITLHSLARKFCYALVPQLIRTHYFNDPSPTANKLHATSWMNGLRGLAALTVFTCHYLAFFTRTIFIGFGSSPQDRWIHQLPIFEFITDGTLSVDIFFIVGGYVCSQKAIELMTRGDRAGLFQTLPASVFRRFFRIYLPVFCSTILLTTLAYIGAYEPTRFLLNDDVKNKLYLGPASEHHPPQFEKLSQFVEWWWSDIFDILNFWKENHPKPILDPHLWTVHHEFRASMHLYIVLVGTALCKSWARISILFILSYIYVAFYTHWVEVSYFWGAILAQAEVLRQRREKSKQVPFHEPGDAKEGWLPKDDEHNLPMSIPSDYFSAVFQPTQRRRVLAWVRCLLFLTALVLMSFPKNAPNQSMPFWDTAVKPYIPSFYSPGRAPHLPKQIGVTLLVYLIGTVPMKQRAKSRWHRLLTLGVPVYLGSIMFAIYLLHGMVLHLGGFVIPQLVWKRWSSANNGEYGEKEDQSISIYLTGLFVGWIVSLTVLLWAADVWTREVEGRCIKITKWLESIVFLRE